MSYIYVPLSGKFQNDLGVLDTETLFIYRVKKDNTTELGTPINNNSFSEGQSLDGFDTLILHVSNLCNLKCKYCFAGHGSYQSPEELMPPEIAIQAVDRFYEKYKYIREIKLFGGEPAINLDTIEVVLNHISNLHSKQIINKMPVFKIITNGTIMSEQFINLVKEYNIKVVFSIDGPESIHDSGRLFRNGSPTFNTVKRNFEILREATDESQPYSIDVTYSNFHENNGFTIFDTVEYLTSTFRIKPQKVNVSLVSDVFGDGRIRIDNINAMSDSAKDTLFAAENGVFLPHMKLKAVIRHLKKRTKSKDSICSAAGRWAAVSVRGDVYPCLMFMDREEYYMGNVCDYLWNKSSYQNVLNVFQNHKKTDNKECAECDISVVCSACMGLNESETGSLYHSSEITCKERKRIVLTAIKGIAEEVF